MIKVALETVMSFWTSVPF